MKTTLDLPDDLMRQVKMRAVNENRRIKDVVTDALRRGMAQQEASADGIRRRVQFPLVETAHPASPAEEVTPDRVASILMSDETDADG